MDGGRILVVPRTPGPLIDPRPQRQREPDEVDELVDELFGPADDTPVGWFDGACLAGGLVLLVLSLTVWSSGALTVVAVILLCLGAILPVRALYRRLVSGRAGRRDASLRSKGLVLDVAHPLTARLAGAYGSLLETADAPDMPFRTEALSAAHMALIESATLLDGAPPSTPSQVAYVEKRVVAIEAFTRAAAAQRLAEERAEQEAREAETAEEHAARAAAGEELDGIGLSSLSDLTSLTRLLRETPREPGA
jgi:hypothetical protein